MQRRHVLVLSFAVLVLASLWSTLLAQQAATAPAATAAPDDASYHMAMGKTHNLHANDHVKLLAKYASRNKTVPDHVLKEHVATVHRNVQSAKASFAKARAAAKDNPEMLKQLDLIDKRLDKVSQLVKKLETQSADSKEVAAQAATISANLAANDMAAQEVDDNFYNMDSSNYYTDGLGHFVD